MLVLWSLFFMQFFVWLIARLTHLTFGPQKRGKQRTLRSFRAFQLATLQVCDSEKVFGDVYSWCWGRLLEFNPPWLHPSIASAPPPLVPTPAQRAVCKYVAPCSQDKLSSVFNEKLNTLDGFCVCLMVQSSNKYLSVKFLPILKKLYIYYTWAIFVPMQATNLNREFYRFSGIEN